MDTHNRLKLEAVDKLKLINKNRDPEEAHVEADAVLCALLAELGFENVVVAYNRINKWYA